jgi:tRNA (cytidine32/uridine32-2'-O)-methyltransferase
MLVLTCRYCNRNKDNSYMSLQSNLINIVLVDTIHPGNIGSVARAMKTMGLSRLSLVNPRVFPSGDANALSGNATDVLENAQIFSSIKDAIKDSTFVYATSSRDRSIQWPITDAATAAKDIHNETTNEKEVSIIFGKEDRGLTNDELECANRLIEIPANPEYPVLNLAMSVQIITYELFKISSESNLKEWRDYPEVNSKQLQMLIDHFIETAVEIDVIDPDNPKKIISRIKRMFARLQPDEMEASFMRGFLSGIKKKLK